MNDTTCPYDLLGIVGKGRFYTVRRVSNRKNMELAIKSTTSVAEMDTLVRLNHPNIIHAYEILDNRYRQCKFLQATINYTMPIGSMNWAQFMKSNPSKEDKIVSYYQILLGLNFLSENKLRHEDIHGGNIVLVNGVWKLIDFQMVKNVGIKSVEEVGNFLGYLRDEEGVDVRINKPYGTVTIEDILSIPYFEGIYNKEDLKLGSIKIPELPFIDLRDDTIGYMINDLIMNNKNFIPYMDKYMLTFDVCYRFLAKTGKLEREDIEILYLVVNSYYGETTLDKESWDYIKVLDYIIHRPSILDYSNSEETLTVAGNLLRNPYEYTKNDLKAMVDEINIKHEPVDLASYINFQANEEFTHIWFPERNITN